MTYKLAFCSDCHLNFCEELVRENFYKSIIAHQPNAVLITGDISEAPTLGPHLCEMHSYVKVPIYYVNGNHDFYLSSIKAVRENCVKLQSEIKDLVYLSAQQELIKINDKTCLIGHDGWYDGGCGDYWGTTFGLADFDYISDLTDKSREIRYAVMNREAKLAADHIKFWANKALEQGCENLLIATHVPPFPRASLYRNQPNDQNAAPFFVSKTMGDCLIDLAEQWADREISVFCGHSHEACIYQPASNLIVHTAGARYHYPAIYDVIEIQ